MAGSPIKLRCKQNILLGKKICRWACIGSVQGARFTRRHNPDDMAIVHPSTKKPGWWQVSFFDAQGPSGDSQRKTCSEAVGLLEPWEWRLREVR